MATAAFASDSSTRRSTLLVVLLDNVYGTFRVILVRTLTLRRHMGNIFKSQEKRDRKKRLFEIGVQTLERDGWNVERATGMGKASVRKLSKGSQKLLVSIRTSQDTWIAFPPKPRGKGWITLDDVNVVLAVSVDNREAPKSALVHWLDAKELRTRFDRAAKANDNGSKLGSRGPFWIPLYNKDDGTPQYAGGGAGLENEPIARVPLNESSESRANGTSNGRGTAAEELKSLTIPTAKRLLSISLGVPESSIKISVEA